MCTFFLLFFYIQSVRQYNMFHNNKWNVYAGMPKIQNEWKKIDKWKIFLSVFMIFFNVEVKLSERESSGWMRENEMNFRNGNKFMRCMRMRWAFILCFVGNINEFNLHFSSINGISVWPFSVCRSDGLLCQTSWFLSQEI